MTPLSGAGPEPLKPPPMIHDWSDAVPVPREERDRHIAEMIAEVQSGRITGTSHRTGDMDVSVTYDPEFDAIEVRDCKPLRTWTLCPSGRAPLPALEKQGSEKQAGGGSPADTVLGGEQLIPPASPALPALGEGLSALEKAAIRVVALEGAYRFAKHRNDRELLEGLPPESEWEAAIDALDACLPPSPLDTAALAQPAPRGLTAEKLAELWETHAVWVSSKMSASEDYIDIWATAAAVMAKLSLPQHQEKPQ